MIKLKITQASGEVTEHVVTPVIEYAFEQYAKTGFMKAFRDNERQTDVYWLSWECLRRAGIGVKPFGADFIETLEKVEILDADHPNG